MTLASSRSERSLQSPMSASRNSCLSIGRAPRAANSLSIGGSHCSQRKRTLFVCTDSAAHVVKLTAKPCSAETSRSGVPVSARSQVSKLTSTRAAPTSAGATCCLPKDRLNHRCLKMHCWKQLYLPCRVGMSGAAPMTAGLAAAARGPASQLPCRRSAPGLDASAATALQAAAALQHQRRNTAGLLSTVLGTCRVTIAGDSAA